MDQNSGATVEIRIGDHNYTLKAGHNPEYVRQVAQYVDEKMQSLSKIAPSFQTLQIAVLTAVNIADEMFQKKGIEPENLEQAQSRIQDLINKIPD